MLKRVGTRLGLILLIADLLLTVLALHLAKLLRLTLPIGVYLDEPLAFGPWFYLLVPTIWALAFLSLRVYDPGRALRYLDDVQATWSAVTWATLVFAGVAYLFFREFSRLLFFYFYLLDLAFLLGWRAVLRWLLRLGLGRRLGEPRRVLVVGAGTVGQELARAVHSYRWTGLEMVGYVDDDEAKGGKTYAGSPVLGTLAEIGTVVADLSVDEVLLALPTRAQEQARRLVLALQALPVNVRVVPDVFDLVFIRASVEEFAGIPLIGLREPAIEGPDRVIKRWFDLLVGGLVLVLLSPLMLVAGLAVRLDSPGPVILRQQRIGEGGRPFWMLKFRTMVVGAETEEQELAQGASDGPPVFLKRADDPRITGVGRVLRRFSIDELPQLINVLKGDMSLVGPRPELPWLVETYRLEHRRRFAVPQGMTGWWQVNGRSDRADYALRIEDDLYYIRNWSVWLDLRILWMTVGAVVRGEGAY
ncbi:MAG TPA: sugar transferase [Chloroflexi bacterium]|mgnify:CR=1 FL=1|nr:sugar transferase [Chloroflexota bacterium]